MTGDVFNKPRQRSGSRHRSGKVLEVSERGLDMGWLASGSAVAGHSGESSLELMFRAESSLELMC
ncbi:hypothetical protein SAMN05428945_4962 [Streptomyces sp. 2224.1]|nr:hypothetical protein BX261_0372 [Streptomyces sp. 2321.6]SDR58187.1 hypothetical protein SAMN05216511_6849 [Streptomyces sp. KS_16]SEB78623.1 hypothetical protein SAMN05428940_0372 [Streptomyces sp. 2133.1]SED46157.1 hypothetical protein SAMN05428945_4962 [Streptomyces sp. 2224.1]SNC60918.1 hypothetical protein SAMN06272741_0373 [Streptomyces sp. 2114.4]